MSKKVVTLYLSEEPYQTLKKIAPALGKSVSVLVDGWIREGLRELTGEDSQASREVDFAALKLNHFKLCRKVEELKRWLKRRKVYDDLSALARQLGLKRDLSNLDTFAPKLLDEWGRSPGHIVEDAHIFLFLVETVKSKKALEGKLAIFRREPEKGTVSDTAKAVIIATEPSPLVKVEEVPSYQGQLKHDSSRSKEAEVASTPSLQVEEEEGWEAEEEWEDDEEEEDEWEEEWVVEE